jgi:tRNA nucleotidyltransferase/poly(A) polymerase
MHRNILTANQVKLLPLIKEFSQDYYLVGGTAIALYLGHRRSIDFDLFTVGTIKKGSIKRLIDSHKFSVTDILFEDSEQIHLVERFE